MLRRSITVLLGLIDRAAGAWVRWRAGRGGTDAPEVEIPMRMSQPPADWVQRVRQGAPGLLEPVGDDHLQVTPAPPDPPPGELEKHPRPQRTAPAGDGEPAAPFASVEPAPPRASHLEMPAPPQSRAKRATAGDSGGSRPLAAEGSAAPAAETPVVGDDHLSQGGIPEQRSVQVTERVVVHDHPPPEIAVRAPVSVEPPPADPTLAKSAKKADPLIPAPAIPIRLSAPISTDPTPKRIHQPDLRAELPGRPAEPQPQPAFAEDAPASASHRWPDLPHPPEERGPDMEGALRKWERDLQVAREQSRL